MNMLSFNTQILILLIGAGFKESLGVINEKNDATSNEQEDSSVTTAYGTPLPFSSANSFSSSQLNSKDNYEARISDFEATTPVFPLTAPSYDYSPSGLHPPEGDDIFIKQSGYSYETPSTTPIPLYGPPRVEPKPVYGPPSTSYLPPQNPAYVLPTPPSPPPLPPKPSYLPPQRPSYGLALQQSYLAPSLPSKYGPPSKPTFIVPNFQHYPAIKTQHAASKPQYSLPKLNYQPFNLPFNIPSSQFYSPEKLQSAYIPPKQDYALLLPSQRYGRPPSKSFYNNFKSSIHSLFANEPYHSSSGNPSPPTPPVISYDGWRPMTGAELNDVQLSLYAANQYTQIPQNYFGSNKFEIKPQSQQLQELFSLSNTYYAPPPLSSNNQILSSTYEVPFDFIKSFSNLALIDNSNGPSNSFQTTNQHLCDDSSSSQIIGNSPSISISGTVKDGHHEGGQPTEQLGLAYGVPSGKQIDGPKLQPKVPVKFRPPVPSGLLESIGKNGPQSFGQSSEFRGQTYIPPAIPEVSKSSEQASEFNDESNGGQLLGSDSLETLGLSGEQFKDVTYDANSAQQANSLKYEISSSNLPYTQSYSNPSDFSIIDGHGKINGLANEYTPLISFADNNSALSASGNALPGLPLDQSLSHGLLQDILSAIDQQNQPSANVFYEKSEGLQSATSNNVPHYVVKEMGLQKRTNAFVDEKKSKLEQNGAS